MGEEGEDIARGKQTLDKLDLLGLPLRCGGVMRTSVGINDLIQCIQRK